ncbi:hypothetical protein [Streptomyces sp. CAU 1734]|uniref:deoxynucleotide monophosphate kinase family protein n=1 Tax=Streptomyces sp. CAU 1734 TaxID=3140360 RepID=UPI0032615775
MGNIGIIGRARSGKDTAGRWLVDHRGYRRVAFADPLKEAALRVNPIVVAYVGFCDEYDHDVTARTLSDVVRDIGWERSKDEYPEVRRFLQELGASMRAVDPNIWLREALARVQMASENGVPAVITDVRYPNEVAALRGRGFHLIYIDRPGIPHLDHESESALTADDAHHVIHNDADVATLLTFVEGVTDLIYINESRRHYARSHS